MVWLILIITFFLLQGVASVIWPERMQKAIINPWLKTETKVVFVRMWGIFAIVISIAIPLIVISDRGIIPRQPSASGITQLKSEFLQIPPMPGATEVRHDFDPETPDIEAVYSINSSYMEIADYYNAELRKHGYRFYKEEKVTDSGRDLGGEMLYYEKGNYVASIQYAGEKANYGWTYAFDVEYGSS